MYKIIQILFLAIILGAFAYVYRAQIAAMPSLIYSKVAPCTRPISYSLGSFDTRFGISKTDFLRAAKQAEATWEDPIGKQLFTHEEGGALKINLIYDYRQQATAKLRGLGITVDDTRASYDSLKQKYETLHQKYLADKELFNKRAAEFEARQSEYAKQVDYWNSRGGAPRDEYEKLNAEKAVLDAKATELNQFQNQISEEIDEVNALVIVLNQLAAKLNIDVAQYNTVSGSRGAEFEQGLYESSAGLQKIDIYEFDSQPRLVRVLAHELGHALGLEHINTDKKAIMYELNQGNNESATKSDIAELKKLCGIK